MKALIIDDSMTTRKIIQGILLGSCGFTEIVQKENGSTGLRELLNSKNNYDIVILDWYMPVMDGIEVLLAIREQKLSIPVLVCTSADDKDSIINAITAGANEYLIKPFNPDAMQRKVKNVVEAYKLKLKKNREKRVLVIDDSEITREMMKKTLVNDINIDDVVFAEDGISALEIFEKQKFDLLLLDWQMPKMDGIQVLKEIRKVDTTTPIIMATGNSEIDHMVSAFDAGATNFISKPFEKDDLIKKVSQQIFITDNKDSQIGAKSIEDYFEVNGNLHLMDITESGEHDSPLRDLSEFDRYVEVWWMKAYRTNSCIAIINLGVDFSREFYKTYDQEKKDYCIKTIGDFVVTNFIKTSELICKYNDRYFGIVIPDTNYYDTLIFIQRVMDGVNKVKVDGSELHTIDSVLISVGATVRVPKGPDDRIVAIKKAEENLSLAKGESGRYKISR